MLLKFNPLERTGHKMFQMQEIRWQGHQAIIIQVARITAAMNNFKKKHYVGQLKISKITPGTFFVQILNPGPTFFMAAGGAGNSACQFSKVGLYWSRLPPTQKGGSFPQRWGGGGLSGYAQHYIGFFRSE